MWNRSKAGLSRVACVMALPWSVALGAEIQSVGRLEYAEVAGFVVKDLPPQATIVGAVRSVGSTAWHPLGSHTVDTNGEVTLFAFLDSTVAGSSLLVVRVEEPSSSLVVTRAFRVFDDEGYADGLDLGTQNCSTQRLDPWELTLVIDTQFDGQAHGVNDWGTFVGDEEGDLSSPGGAFRYQDGVYTRLDPIGSGGSARDVNNAGIAVGMSLIHPIGTADVERHATAWGLDQVPQDLGSLCTTGPGSTEAYAINELGEVAGWAEKCSGNRWAAVFFNGEIVRLPRNRESSRAADINDRGQVVGTDVWVTSNGTAAFLYSDGETYEIPGFGGYNAEATAINNRGEVVGWSEKPWSPFPSASGFHYHDGVLTELVPLPGDTDAAAMAIDDRGWVYGQSADPNHTTPVVWRDGVPTEIEAITQDPSHMYHWVGDVNASGAVVGTKVMGPSAYWSPKVPFLAEQVP